MDTDVRTLCYSNDERSVSKEWRDMDEKSLVTLLFSREGLKSVLKLTGGDAEFVVNILDRALESLKLDHDQQKKCKRALRKLCGTLLIFPTSYVLNDGLVKIEDKPSASGHFASVWKGRYNGEIVAIKALKTTSPDDKKVKKRFAKEAVVWKQLSHPNLLPFLGVATAPLPLVMVSPWMDHGNIVQYVKLHPDTNRLRLLLDITEGLKYLHENEHVHGDLKGDNILIDNNHRACLADFGLMTIIPDSVQSVATTTVGLRGTVRWMAPELLLPESFGLKPGDHTLTIQSDVYAFGMVIYQVMSGNFPFKKWIDNAVIMKVTKGFRPDRPDDCVIFGLTDDVWRLAEQCWDHDRNRRPPIHEVLDGLNNAAQDWSPPPLGSITVNLELGTVVDSTVSDNLSEWKPPPPTPAYVVQATKEDEQSPTSSGAQLAEEEEQAGRKLTATKKLMRGVAKGWKQMSLKKA